MSENYDRVHQIQALISEKLFVEVDSPDTDLFETGTLDSAALIELLLGLEERFGFILSLAELELDDIRTIRKIAGLVAQTTAASSEVQR
ncbi:MAG: hypothetical protein DMG13_11570 [Acidobacteria bacterium]|nr:MAG: hypothetical protein DMG13_11570 [Acidobacteriota bacterium]